MTPLDPRREAARRVAQVLCRQEAARHPGRTYVVVGAAAAVKRSERLPQRDATGPGDE